MDQNLIRKQSTFSRSLANEAKLGAYYTDTGMSRRIGYLFEQPEGEVCILEPSIGDGSAVKEVLKGADADMEKTYVFGVELNTAVCRETLEGDEEIHYCLNTDFLNGVKISHDSFGFCFANPPYGTDDKGMRLEQRFVEKLQPYLKNGAPFALVLPYYVATEERFLKSYMTRFQPVGFYKFDDSVYKQFQQVVLAGYKKKSMCLFKESFDGFSKLIGTLEKVPYLPRNREDVKQRFSMVPGSQEAVEYFTTLEFNRREAGDNLYRSALKEKLSLLGIPEYSSAAIGQPPVPLKKDLLYMLAISGGGQGLVGSEAEHDLHLQRGCAKVVKKNEVEEKGKSSVMVERTYTQIVLNIIENDGTISTLQ